MVDINGTCQSCVHNEVCRYAKDFEIVSNSLIEVAKESVDKEYWQNLVDLKIRCRKYVMAPYQQVKVERNRMPQYNFEFPKPDFMKTSVDLGEDVK